MAPITALHSIRYDRIPVSSAGLLLSLAKEKIIFRDSDLVRTQCQRRFTYNTGTELGQFALRHIRVIVRNKYSLLTISRTASAKKLQTFIVFESFVPDVRLHKSCV